MTWAGFGEKQYEQAFNHEIWGKRGVFPPDQVLEGIVGFDAAAHPDPQHVVWQILGVPRPKGLKLLPVHWTGGAIPVQAQLPTWVVSLILQYKRPEYLAAPPAKQWHQWHQPYFRFTRSTGQQRILARIERRMGKDVAVRYASPAFWLMGDLERAQVQGTVVSHSGFVRPRHLGKHRVWTYTAPGNVGYPNPSGEGQEFEDFNTVIRGVDSDSRVGAELIPSEGLGRHVTRLGEAVSEREPRLRKAVAQWRQELVRRELPLQASTIDLLCAIAATNTLLDDLGASWFLVDVASVELYET